MTNVRSLSRTEPCRRRRYASNGVSLGIGFPGFEGPTFSRTSQPSKFSVIGDNLVTVRYHFEVFVIAFCAHVEDPSMFGLSTESLQLAIGLRIRPAQWSMSEEISSTVISRPEVQVATKEPLRSKRIPNPTHQSVPDTWRPALSEGAGCRWPGCQQSSPWPN